MNLPNKITLSRVLLIPVFMVMLFWDFGWGEFSFLEYTLSFEQLIATLIFAILSLTDWLDGYLARKYNLVTNFGKFLDPLADKMLVTAGFVALVELGFVPAWMVILILSREFAVTGLRLLASSEGLVIAAANLGKLKTTLQIVTILVFLMHIDNIFTQVILWFAVFITVYSGIDYFYKNKHLFENDKKEI